MSIQKKWIRMLNESAKGSRRKRNILTPIGATIYFFIILLFVYGAFKLDRIFDLPQFLTWPANFIIALPVTMFGLFFMLWSVFNFLSTKGTPVPFNPPPTLVATGPYAHVRNPMLSGLFFIMFGIGFYEGSISLVFIATPLFVLVNYLQLKYIKEPELEKMIW